MSILDEALAALGPYAGQVLDGVVAYISDANNKAEVVSKLNELGVTADHFVDQAIANAAGGSLIGKAVGSFVKRVVDNLFAELPSKDDALYALFVSWVSAQAKAHGG